MNVDFPYRIAANGRTALTDDADHVRDMIELVLFSSPGERVMRPDFGTGLLQSVFSPNTPEVAAALRLTVQAALNKWLGDVMTVQDISVEAIDSELRVAVAYSVTATGEAQVATFVRSTA
jgi:Bacteriophage baseplate protein W